MNRELCFNIFALMFVCYAFFYAIKNYCYWDKRHKQTQKESEQLIKEYLEKYKEAKE